MITAPELRALLDGLARKFDGRPLHETGVVSGEAQGWGQFLDSQPQHNQIGPFGTCSGVITRALANRGADVLDERVNLLLRHWWSERHSPESHARFLGQTIRLAMLHLALRVRKSADTAEMTQEVAASLMASMRPENMWGNYVMPHDIEDPSPRVVATSLAVLSFTMFREAEEGDPPAQLVSAIKQLEDRLLGSEDLPRLHVAIAVAAILSLGSHKPSRKTLRRIRTIAYSTQVSLPDLGVYFYDYEFVKESSPSSSRHAGNSLEETNNNAYGPQESKTDYFIVPTELILGIAGYMPLAPVRLRLRAESTVKLLVKNLRGYDGYYRPDPEQRISSVNQGWVAMYLALAEQALAEPDTSLMSGWRRFFARIAYQSMKQRPDSAWLDFPLLVLSGTAIVFANWAIPLSSTGRSLAVRILTACLGFIAGRLYAPASVKRIFVERP